MSDKAGLVALARALAERGVEMLSTGGTAAALDERGASGRRRGADHRLSGDDGRAGEDPASARSRRLARDPLRTGASGGDDRQRHRADRPPHRQSLSVRGDARRADASFEERIENIDIGGPAMIRGAAKNHDDVAVIVDVADYSALLDELARNDGATSLAFRRRMAQKAYARTAAYDAAISNWLAREVNETAPKWRAFGGVLHESFGALRYGENPHQRAALYLTGRDAARRGDGAAGPGQGALLQQHQRH